MHGAGTYAGSNSLLVDLRHVDFDGFYLFQLAIADRPEEAVMPAGVAGHAGLLDLDQQRVAVAINAEIDQLLDVARRVALAPGTLARARPVADAAGAHRLDDGVPVHPGHHQDLAAAMLLGDGGHESLGVELDLREHLVDRGLRISYGLVRHRLGLCHDGVALASGR